MEKSSPRGRIRLIKAVADGDLPVTEGFVDEMNFCLDCQACETACPAGVKYGSLVEAARAQIYRGGYESTVSRSMKKIFLEWFFVKHARLKMLSRFLRLYQQSGLQRLIELSGLLKLFSRKLSEIQPLSPKISSKFSTEVLTEVHRPEGSPRYRVGFLTGCLMDVAFSDVNLDTVALLLHHGCEVVIPKDQVCCGSLQAHNGGRDTARVLAKKNILAFEGQNLDYIVMNSAGCGAFMKEYGHLFHDDELSDRARSLSSRVKDITEFLTETSFHKPRALHTFSGKRVTYHDACHLVHTQKVSQQPRTLLRSVPGIEYVELPESSWCCGSAGIYNIVRYEDSMKLLDRKVENIKLVRPDVIVTGNPGCLVQIQHGLRKQGMEVELLHTATFLRRACEA